ncbi:SHOCT domain-containing protein [Leucobacter luti]|nr:SHOCT domain-containing protein [Leucobacter luti]
MGRVGRPGLLGMAARTAVVAGTATAVSGAVARRQHERAVAAQAQAAPVPAPAPAPAPAAAAPAPAVAPAPAGTDLVAQLQQLAALQQQGLLSAAEFEQAKQQLLGS